MRRALTAAAVLSFFTLALARQPLPIRTAVAAACYPFVDHFEWTQAIQDADNGVALVDGKATTVRMYVVPSAGCPPSQTFSNVSAHLNATLAGVVWGYNSTYWRPDAILNHADTSTGFNLATRRVEQKTLNFTFATFVYPASASVTVMACLFPDADRFVPPPTQCEHWQYSTMPFLKTSFTLDILAVPFYLNSGAWTPSANHTANGYADDLFNGALPLPSRSIRYIFDPTRAITDVNTEMLSNYFMQKMARSLGNAFQENDYVLGWLPLAGPIADVGQSGNPEIWGRHAKGANYGVATAEDEESRTTIVHEYLHSVGLIDNETWLADVGWDVRPWIEWRSTGRAIRDTSTRGLMSPGTDGGSDRDYWSDLSEYTAGALGSAFGMGGRLLRRYRSILITPLPNPGDPWPWSVGESYELEGKLRPIVAGTSGTMELRVLNDIGGLLYCTHFDPPVFTCRAAEGGECDDELAPAEIVVPQNDDYHAIELYQDGVLQDAISRTLSVPLVTILSPQAGERLTDTATVRWEMSDADGGPLQAHVLYSADSQLHTARTVAAWNSTGEAVVPFASMPAGAAGTIYVVAFDGFNTTVASVGGLVVSANHPPSVYLKSPADGAIIPCGANVILDGAAHDLEDGWLGETLLLWSSDVDGVLGSGATLNVGTLSAGAHRIMLSTTDSGGLPASSFVSVTIE